MKSFIAIMIVVAACNVMHMSNAGTIPETPLPQNSQLFFENITGISFVDRIVGGEEATSGQFPYQAVLYPVLSNFVSLCGGSILSNSFILTAAHCLDNAISCRVVLGAHNKGQNEPEQVKYDVKSANLIMHEQYNDNSQISNDIALIKLPNPVTYTPRIQPIALPSRSDINTLFVGVLATVSGYGETSNLISKTDVLKFAKTTVITNDECRKSFSVVLNSNICTVEKNGNACFGDSGGPLALTHNGKLIQVGIVSFGSRTCEKGYPVAFARVTSFLDWISSKSGITIEN